MVNRCLSLYPFRLFYILLNIFPIWALSQEKLQYHLIQSDPDGRILPWYNKEPSVSFDHVIDLVWNFWDTMRVDLNGLPYYMNHQVWRPSRNDPRGIGGDQLTMAMESWRLLYAYSGNERMKENIRFMADYYLSHGLSDQDDLWPHLPYPYNTLIYSGKYDGDMILGKDFLQPDKAGSFGLELLYCYKMTAGEVYPNITTDQYLQAAINIANTLASRLQPGNDTKSPLPFKINAKTGKAAVLIRNTTGIADSLSSQYTTNWSGTLELWWQLIQLKKGNTTLYRDAFDALLRWMELIPLQNNKWGPFFEDVPGWSDTQINAITFAQFIMNHTDLFIDWKTRVTRIFNWVYSILGNEQWKKYGVIAINEQTAYRVPGNSHTSRQAAAQLQFAYLSGDTTYQEPSLRQLIWATYMVDRDGKNKYLQDENWLTDGYGDYVRHYLKSMNYYPEAAIPSTHLLHSTSVVQHAFYHGSPKYYFPYIKDYLGLELHYTVFDSYGEERIRMSHRPGRILFDGKSIDLFDAASAEWQSLKSGGVLTIHRRGVRQVSIYK